MEKGMTQKALIKKIRVDVSYLSNLENGKRNPTLSTLEKIAKALGVTPVEFLK